MSAIDFIEDLGLVMLIAAAAAWLCQRIGLPVVTNQVNEWASGFRPDEDQQFPKHNNQP